MYLCTFMVDYQVSNFPFVHRWVLSSTFHLTTSRKEALKMGVETPCKENPSFWKHTVGSDVLEQIYFKQIGRLCLHALTRLVLTC